MIIYMSFCRFLPSRPVANGIGNIFKSHYTDPWLLVREITPAEGPRNNPIGCKILYWVKTHAFIILPFYFSMCSFFICCFILRVL